MMKNTIFLFLAIAFYCIWFFQYFLSYIEGANSVIATLLQLCGWIFLFGVACFHLFKWRRETTKNNKRLFYSILIFIFNLLSLVKPQGLIDWEKYEDENLLVAVYIGVVSCQTTLKLRPNNNFKYINSCFQKDFHFGTYKLINDTLYFEVDKNLGFMDKSTYAILKKSNEDTSQYRILDLYRNPKETRCISFFIKKINWQELKKQK